MESPTNPIESRDQYAEVSGYLKTHSIPDKTPIPESLSEEIEKSQEAEELDGQNQKLELSIEEDETDTSSSFNCCGGGPKRKKGSNKKRKQQDEKSKEKLKVLVETLKLVPFKPLKTLDFARNESLLKTLTLWDFVNLEFDQCINCDLVAQLIAYYRPEAKCSYINGSRINLSRADLARALKLPSKKERVVILDEDKELLESDESISFVEDFVSNWILLHCDDAWMMPDEVVEWNKGIKEMQLDKLDWAGLIWFMLEKELKAEPPLGNCFYASHMQMLIRSQKKILFKEQAKVEDDVDLKESDDIADVNPKIDDGISDSKEEKFVEEGMIELNLGQETVSEMADEEEHDHEKQPMDLEEIMEDEDGKWIWNINSHSGSHFLQGCDVGGTAGDERIKKEAGENEDVAEEEIEEDGEEHEGGFLFFPNGETPQEILMLGDTDTSSLGCNSDLQIHGNSAGDFLASRSGMHMVPGSSHFGNGNKREIDHGNDMSYQFDNPATKRLKTNGPSWDDDKPVPFEECMEQIMQLAGKAKLSYVKKDRACAESNMRQQTLLNELERREGIIQQLHKETYEEQQRKDIEIFKLENELRMMTSVLAGYRKTLKDTQKAYRKHMKCCLLREKNGIQRC